MPKKAIYFTTPKKHVHQTSKKIVFLHCCEPVLLCAFNAQNRVQFAWAKKYTRDTHRQHAPHTPQTKNHYMKANKAKLQKNTDHHTNTNNQPNILLNRHHLEHTRTHECFKLHHQPK